MTEKDYAPQKKESKKMVVKTPKEKQELNVEKKKTEDKKNEEIKETKKPIIKKEIKKKDSAFINGVSLPISTKQSTAICRFIKGKTIENSIDYLEKVIQEKKAIPMRGEIPHRKGKIMSGRFPKNASKEFIKLLKTLKGNSTVNGIEIPIIVEAIANKAQRPYGKFGRVQKKRTHIKIIVKEKNSNKTKEKK